MANRAIQQANKVIQQATQANKAILATQVTQAILATQATQVTLATSSSTPSRPTPSTPSTSRGGAPAQASSPGLLNRSTSPASAAARLTSQLRLRT